MNHVLSTAALAGAALLSAAPAHAQDAALLHTRALAATCANCHGTDGRAAAGSSITSLAGLDRAYLVKQMTDFQSGARPATVMHQITKGFTPAQLEQIAGYFAAQAK